MKKIILIVTATTMLFAMSKSRQLNNNIFDKNETIKEVKLKTTRNGIVSSKKVFVLKNKNENKIKTNSTNNIINYGFSNGDKFNSKSKIIVKFANKKIDINYIEHKYNLKYIRKMNSGDHIFENTSGNTLYIINNMLDDKSINIKRINPNMILNIKPL
ncbi:MAG: hypothetical protein B1H07_03390 [Campylobacteraceae bacterium 4484_166]|nr:MAG: hypothetical protein B1H07_03390 [Campylobacteraceae bacterium 4484_166]